MLKKFRSKHPVLALVNQNGGPLRRREFTPDGRHKHCDNIKSAYERLCRKLGTKPRPLKLLRKTAASKLEDHDSYGRYAQYFLGKAPASDTERRYARPSPEQFDKAVLWLGKELGLA